MEEKIYEIVRSFRRFNRAFYQHMREAAAELGITAVQLFVLQVLAKRPNIGLGELAEQLQVGNSTMSGIVERLVKAGFVTRERSVTDRRLLTVQLTSKGEIKQKESYALSINRMSKLLVISDEDVETLLNLHEQILNNLTQEGDKAEDE